MSDTGWKGVCQHGWIKTRCPSCSAEEEIARLNAVIDEQRRQGEDWQQKILTADEKIERLESALREIAGFDDGGDANLDDIAVDSIAIAKIALYVKESRKTHRDDLIYCTVHRNGSGQDSGRIDYSIDHGSLSALSESDREEVVRVVRQLLIALNTLVDGCTCAVCHSPV